MSNGMRRALLAAGVLALVLFAGRWTATTLADRWWGLRGLAGEPASPHQRSASVVAVQRPAKSTRASAPAASRARRMPLDMAR